MKNLDVTSFVSVFPTATTTRVGSQNITATEISERFDQLKNSRIALMQANIPLSYADGLHSIPPIPLVNTPKPAPAPMWELPEEDDEEEEEMCNEFTNTEVMKTNYLENRVYSIKAAKDSELERKFGLTDDESPKTPADFVDRILKGKYTITEDNKNRKAYSPADYIKWRDPNLKKDEVGYREAFKKLEVLTTAAMDSVKVLSDEAARLKALQDFESATIN